MHSPTVDALSRAWQSVDCATNLAVLDVWADECPEFAGARGDFGAVHDAVIARPDQTLGFLVRRVQAGDADAELAGMVAIHQLLPGLSKRAVTNGGDLDQMIGHCWSTMATYPIDRSPTYVARGLIRDTAASYRACEWLDPHEGLGGLGPIDEQLEEAVWQGRVVHPVAGTAADAFVDATVDWTAEQLVRAALRLELISDETAEMLMAASGPHSPSKLVVAAEHGWDYPVLRQRCSRAVRLLSTIEPDRLAAA